MAATSSSSSDSGSEGLEMFAEPSDFRPSTPPPTQAFYSIPHSTSSNSASTSKITLNLIGSHPLWGHHLWNASPILSDYLSKYSSSLVKDKDVLELGAAAALPSIVSKKLGARNVVATDYPDNDLVENMSKNLQSNLEESASNGNDKGKGKAVGIGYIWGHDESPLLDLLSHDDGNEGRKKRFGLLLLSDLVFNHQAHEALLKTCDSCLPLPNPNPRQQVATNQIEEQFPETFEKETSTPCALVFFTHHRPHLAHKDMAFFELAREKGWKTEKVGQWKMPVSIKKEFRLL